VFTMEVRTARFQLHLLILSLALHSMSPQGQACEWHWSIKKVQ
jgi:hypothetical protein